MHLSRALTRLRAFHEEERGQTLVLVALLFTLLLGFAGAAVDAGRFYAERRYLQNAVDAGAISCAYNYGLTGAGAQDAYDRGLEVVNQNLTNDPIGVSIVPIPALASPQYDGTVTPKNLSNGIMPVTSPTLGCRVAVRAVVPTVFMKLVGISTINLGAQAYAKAKGGQLPSVTKRFFNPPGPAPRNPTGQIQEPSDEFIDVTMQSGSDWACTSTSSVGCTPASLALPGREFVLFGQSAKATNDASFRGFIGLDIRDFTTQIAGVVQHTAYNGVPADASANTLKNLEERWIREGYPGPDICVVVVGAFAPCAQIAALSGANAGTFIGAYYDHFRVGDRMILQLYDGIIKKFPDFVMLPPQLNVRSNATNSSSISFSFNSQFASNSYLIHTEVVKDEVRATPSANLPMQGDPNSPFNNPAQVTNSGTLVDFTANTTSYTQPWTGITLSNAANRGISNVFLRATGGGRDVISMVSVNVEDSQPQVRDYSLGNSDTYYFAGSLRPAADFNIVLTTGNGSRAWNGGNITLSWDTCPINVAGTIQLTCRNMDNLTSTIPKAVGTTTVFQAVTTGQPTGSYFGWIRATGQDGTNPTGRWVTHLLKVQVDIETTPGGTTEYIDVLGYAAFEVTAITSNEVKGRAITPAVLDPNDARLAIAKKYMLVPWETD